MSRYLSGLESILSGSLNSLPKKLKIIFSLRRSSQILSSGVISLPIFLAEGLISYICVNRHISAMYNTENILRLNNEIFYLETLKRDSANLEHAVYTWDDNLGREGWVPFIPTKFIYNFFTFNALCNIDWFSSVEKGIIIEFDSHQGVPESKKIEYYLDFCFSDTEFWCDSMKKKFCEMVLGGRTCKEVKDILAKIDLDRNLYGEVNRANGNIFSSSFIADFRKAVWDTLTSGDPQEANIKKIYNFIQKIRCNIFHGIKSITEMQDPDQQDRIEIYSRFLSAANTIVFDYLHFLENKVDPFQED